MICRLPRRREEKQPIFKRKLNLQSHCGAELEATLTSTNPQSHQTKYFEDILTAEAQ
jgi:hypothetical protein